MVEIQSSFYFFYLLLRYDYIIYVGKVFLIEINDIRPDGPGYAINSILQATSFNLLIEQGHYTTYFAIQYLHCCRSYYVEGRWKQTDLPFKLANNFEGRQIRWYSERKKIPKQDLCSLSDQTRRHLRCFARSHKILRLPKNC